MRYKIDQYLEAGCKAVWVLDPEKREVEVFEPGARPRVLVAEDSLERAELLPGLRPSWMICFRRSSLVGF